jgi:hypothetical protein
MKLDLPFWFKQRQAKAEELATGSYKVTGPNLPEAVLSVRIGQDLLWRGYLQPKADGPPVAESAEFSTSKEAMAAAFDLYRTNMIF